MTSRREMVREAAKDAPSIEKTVYQNDVHFVTMAEDFNILPDTLPRQKLFGNSVKLGDGGRCVPSTLRGTLNLSNGPQRRSGIGRRRRAAFQIQAVFGPPPTNPPSVQTFAVIGTISTE